MFYRAKNFWVASLGTVLWFLAGIIGLVNVVFLYDISPTGVCSNLWGPLLTLTISHLLQFFCGGYAKIVLWDLKTEHREMRRLHPTCLDTVLLLIEVIATTAAFILGVNSAWWLVDYLPQQHKCLDSFPSFFYMTGWEVGFLFSTLVVLFYYGIHVTNLGTWLCHKLSCFGRVTRVVPAVGLVEQL